MRMCTCARACVCGYIQFYGDEGMEVILKYFVIIRAICLYLLITFYDPTKVNDLIMHIEYMVFAY